MPTASITMSIAVGAPTGGVFPVTYTITSQSEFEDANLLLLRQENDKLDRLCSLYDIGDYPEVSTIGIEFYRASTVTVNYTSVDRAHEGIESFKESVQFLVTAMAYFREKLASEVFTRSESW